MKKTFAVYIEKHITIEIPDKLLTEEALDEYCRTIQLGADWDDYWKHAAQYVARVDSSFVEGIGRVNYLESFEDVEVEEIKQ